MAKQISIKKLKRIMYACLRWRLQVPNYVPHKPIPQKSKLGHHSQGVLIGYQDLLVEIEKIERTNNQSRVYNDKSVDEFVDEYGWERNP